jgi:hypothetical protein
MLKFSDNLKYSTGIVLVILVFRTILICHIQLYIASNQIENMFPWHSYLIWNL